MEPTSAIGMEIGRRGAKNNAVQTRFVVILNKFAMSILGPSKSLLINEHLRLHIGFCLSK
jgi:hypothetical protein